MPRVQTAACSVPATGPANETITTQDWLDMLREFIAERHVAANVEQTRRSCLDAHYALDQVVRAVAVLSPRRTEQPALEIERRPINETDSVSAMRLPMALLNHLDNKGIQTVGDLAEHTETSLRMTKGIGQKFLAMIITELGAEGFQLRPPP